MSCKCTEIFKLELKMACDFLFLVYSHLLAQ